MYGVKVTQNVTQYPRHHVTYAQAKFEVATSKSLWGDAFTRNILFDPWPWPWGQGHTKCHPVPFTSCDLCIYKVWSCYVQRFRRRYNYKKRDGRTVRRTDGRTTDRLWYGINIPYFSNEKVGIITRALIRLCRCAGWSAPVQFVKPQRQVLPRRGPIIMYEVDRTGDINRWCQTRTTTN